MKELNKSIAKELLSKGRDISFVKNITGISITKMLEYGFIEEILLKDHMTGLVKKTGIYRAKHGA